MHASTLEWPCFGSRRPGARLGVLAAGAALAMAARRGGRHGPRFGRGGFGPFFGPPCGFPRGPRARRGDVRAAGLLLLAEGPFHGYQILQEIEKGSAGPWPPSPRPDY